MGEYPSKRPAQWISRHSAIVRITHWVNFLCLTILLMSGLQIFNAHPALYWGQASDFEHPLIAMAPYRDEQGGLHGVTTVLGHDFDTTGVLGVSSAPDGGLQARGFPAWATLPGEQWLAMGRRWHFFFAWLFVFNGLAYLVSGLVAAIFGAIWLQRATNCAISAARFGTTCGCASQKGRKPAATTCCKSWRIWLRCL